MNIKIFLKKIMLPLIKIDLALPTKGIIFDIGCGEGVVSNFLAERSLKRKLIGIDKDKEKIKIAKKYNKVGKRMKFIKGDIFTYHFSAMEGVIISDFLHHLEYNKQKILLQSIYKNLKINGICLIKEIDSSDRCRAKLSYWWDSFFYPKDRINYWQGTELAGYLETLGFQVKKVTAAKLFPGSINLFICQKSKNIA